MKTVNNGYNYPSTSLLYKINSDNQFTNREYIKEDAQRLMKALKAYRLKGVIQNYKATPFAITFYIAPEAGESIKNYRDLHAEFEMCLGADIDISTHDDNICITKKNPIRPVIGLRGLLEDEAFQNNDYELPVAAGVDVYGQNLYFDLTAMPHLLIAGTTGSGKTVFIDDILISLLMSRTPDEVRFLIIDPKKCDFSIYNGIPHLISPVISDSYEAMNAISGIEDEMMRRYDIFSRINVRNIKTYNAHVEEKDRFPRIVLVIDEYMDLLFKAKSEIEDHVKRLSSLGRASGVHLILSTQRPTAKVITPAIKANLPARASFTTVDGRESRAILEQTGAQKLMGNGDMLLSTSDSSAIIHAQAALVTVPEIKKVVAAVRKN